MPSGPTNNPEASASVSSEPGPSGTYPVRVADLENSKDRAKYEQFFRGSIGMTDKGIKNLLYTVDNGGYLQMNLENNPNISKKAVSEIDTAILYYIKNCHHSLTGYSLGYKIISQHAMTLRWLAKSNNDPRGCSSRPDVTIEELTEDSPVDDSVGALQ